MRSRGAWRSCPRWSPRHPPGSWPPITASFITTRVSCASSSRSSPRSRSSFYCYWSRTRPRGAAAGTAWIPLGVVGQSTAASTLLFDAHLYGLIMFTLGVPCVLYAMYCFYEAVLQWAPYGPGWWGSTFPVGTMCLGAWDEGWHTLSLALLVFLLLHWGVCAVRFGAWEGSRT
nr:hypothetical protein [Corynebacterium meitnerae]